MEKSAMQEKKEPNHVTLMRRATREIKDLREHNRIMSAKLEMFDKCMILVKTDGGRGDYGMKEAAPDICFEIEKEISSISNT